MAAPTRPRPRPRTATSTSASAGFRSTRPPRSIRRSPCRWTAASAPRRRSTRSPATFAATARQQRHPLQHPGGHRVGRHSALLPQQRRLHHRGSGRLLQRPGLQEVPGRRQPAHPRHGDHRGREHRGLPARHERPGEHPRLDAGSTRPPSKRTTATPPRSSRASPRSTPRTAGRCWSRGISTPRRSPS